MQFDTEGVDLSKISEKVRYSDAIGRAIICEDGIGRRVVTICGSFQYPWKAIINEPDPDSKSGFFVNLLSLTWQLQGKGIPPKEKQVSYEKVIRALSWNQQPKAKYRMSPSGVIVPV